MLKSRAICGPRTSAIEGKKPLRLPSREAFPFQRLKLERVSFSCLSGRTFGRTEASFAQNRLPFRLYVRIDLV
jgi:hypothetical protein